MPFLAPVIASVSGWVTGVLAAGGLGAFALRLGGSLLLSAASRARMPKPDTSIQSRQVSARQPVAPREIVYGKVRKGGTIVFIHTSGQGSGTELLNLVIVLTGHRVKALNAIYFDGEMAVDASGVVQSRYSGKLWIAKKLGLPGQTAFPGIMNEAPIRWTSAHKLEGCACLQVQLLFDSNTYPNGIPNITVDIEGKDDIYDPRTATSGYTTNAALCVADYMADARYGIGATIGAEDGIDSATLIEAANICDEDVTLSGGGTEKRYTCNGVATLAEDPKTIIEGMLTSMAGRCAMQGGSWRIYAGAYRIPTIDLDEDDFAPGGFTMATRVSMSSNFNGVRGQFVSPTNDWQPDDFPAYQSAVYLAEDGGEERWRDISLPFTTSAARAQRLAKIELERGRRQMSVEMSGKLSAWRAAVGETITLSYARWGLAAKPFDVMNCELSLTDAGGGPALLPRLSLRETSPLVYDWLATEEQIYAAAPRTTLPSAFDTSAPSGLSVAEGLYQTRNSTGIKVEAVLTWVASTSPMTAQYQAEASIDGGVTWQVLGLTPNTTFTAQDVKPGKWQWRVKSISTFGVSSAYDTVSQEIFGLGAKPAALTNVTLQSAGGIAIIKWDRHPDLDVRIGGNIVIRHSSSSTPSWTTSYSMDRVAGDVSLAAVPLKPGTYILRAEDSSGVLSDPVNISSTGVQAVAFANVASLQEDPAFNGARTGVFADGTGSLRLDTSIPIDQWPNIDSIPSIDTYGGIGTSQTVNLLTETEDFAAADWIKSEVTISGGATPDPTGVGTADKVIASTNNAQHRVYQIPAWIESTTYTVSVYAKAAGYDWLSINIFGGATSAAAWFNVATGELGAVDAGASVAIEDAGGGWYRCSYTRATDDAGTPNFRLYVCDVDHQNTFAGNGTSGLYLWGAQLEIGPAVTAYTENNATIDVAGEYRFASGLDFGAVTNVRLRSEIDVSALSIFSDIDSRPEDIDDWADFDGAAGAEVDVVMEIRTTDDDPAGSPTWSNWGRLDNSELAARGVEARARLMSLDSGITPLVSKLRLHADEVV